MNNKNLFVNLSLIQEKIRKLTCKMQGRYTFSNFSFMGIGLSLVTMSAISLPILNASSLDRPCNNTNIESVSP